MGATRFLILAAAVALCAASAAQQSSQQGQQGSHYSGGGMDATGCSDVCTHVLQCYGVTDQTQYGQCVQQCQAGSPDPQKNYDVTQLSCDDTKTWIEGQGQAPAGSGGAAPTAGGGATSCPGTVSILGSWGHGGGQMEELTFYANGRVAYRLSNIEAGTTEAAGTYTLACPSLTVNLTEGYWAGTNMNLQVLQRGIGGDGQNWGKCPDAGCF